MVGRPKKDDSRDKQYRVRLNDKEDDMLAFASKVTGIPKSEIFRKAMQDYYEKVKLQQAANEIGNDAEWEDDRLSLQRAVDCPYCSEKNRIDLQDGARVTTSDRQMGEEILYEFEEAEYKCRVCNQTFTVSGYISEYPIGAFNAEKLIIAPITTLPTEPTEVALCRNCGAILEPDSTKELCPDCREKNKEKWMKQLKTGAKIVGTVAVAVGAAYLATRGKDDDDTEDEDFDESTSRDLPHKFKLLMKYSDGTEEEEDEIFDSEADAREYGEYLVSCSREGAEILELSNPGDYPWGLCDDPDYEVVEVE